MVSITTSVELTKFAIRSVVVNRNAKSVWVYARSFRQFASIGPDDSLVSRFHVVCYEAFTTRTALDEKTTQKAEIHDEKPLHSTGG